MLHRQFLRDVKPRIRSKAMDLKFESQATGEAVSTGVSGRIISHVRTRVGSQAEESKGGRKLAKAADTLAQRCAEHIQAAARAGTPLALPLLGELLNLNEFERRCILAALALHVDNKYYNELYPYAQDGSTGWPTVGLALDLFVSEFTQRFSARQSFLSGGRLRRFRIIDVPESDITSMPILRWSFRLDERIADFLLRTADQPIDSRLHSVAELQFEGRVSVANRRYAGRADSACRQGEPPRGTGEQRPQPVVSGQGEAGIGQVFAGPHCGRGSRRAGAGCGCHPLAAM